MAVKLIQQNKVKAKWILETKHTAYVLGVDWHNNLQHLYWGEKLPFVSDYPNTVSLREFSFDSPEQLIREEYSPWGAIRYKEPGIKVTFADGVRSLQLEYANFHLSHDGVQDELVIIMLDPVYKLEVQLYYRPLEEFDLIERWVTVTNKGTEPAQLEQVLSAVWHVPQWQEYRLSHLFGQWIGETQLVQTMLTPGKKMLESRRGTTSPEANPWFAIDGGNASETNGQVYYGALAWSGNWKIVMEEDTYGRLQIAGGVHDFDFSWQIGAGESFVTPAFVGGYTGLGFGGASRNLHNYQLNYVLPHNHRSKVRPILYNSWEATGFAVDEAGQRVLAEKAASLGVELFVLDDGWFGGRNNDRAGLGDWFVNNAKFPEGLGNLIAYVNSLGMDFGLWVEPEMVNKDSDLYRQHPEWIYHFPNRPNSEYRNQLVLNLARSDVKEYVENFMIKLLSEHNIKFIKWDMNRHFSEPGWLEVAPAKQREVWVRHVINLYAILERLRSEFPEVLFEACSGGGGRVDLGILARADQVWTSDNTDAFDRLTIQHGFSHAYAPKAMVAWVTDSPNWVNKREVDLEYRFHVAMMGTLGIGGNLNQWSDAAMAVARQKIADYKEIREIIQHGEQYRLLPPTENVVAVQYVTRDKTRSAVFVFLHAQQFMQKVTRIKLVGLANTALYKVQNSDVCLSGKALAELGLDVQLNGDYQSELIILEKKC